jgi:ketosteroid isomerase-like protein
MTNVEIVRSFYEAVARGDLDAALANLADDVAWTEAEGFPYAGTKVGPAAVKEQVFHRLGAEWDPFVFDRDEVLDAGETVVGLGTYSATYKATGRSMRARVAHVWKLRDGKVTAFEQFVDSAKVLEALEG